MKIIKVLIFLFLLGFTTHAFAKGECVYKTETVSKNGKVVSSKETKICTEHTKFNYGLIDFITDPETEEIVVLTAILILTDL